MKKLLFIISLVAIFMTSSCQKELPAAISKIDVNQGGQQTEKPSNATEQELKVSESGLFGAKGGELSITITATAAWVINKSSGSDWLTVKPESGSSGSTRVTLVATENTSRESRTAALTVQSGDITKKIEVSQSASNPEFSLDTNNLEFTSDSGSKTFEIVSNTSWKVSSSQTWCSVSPFSGSNDGTITVRVDENSSTLERTATITVESETITRTLFVTQSGATHQTSQDRIFAVSGVQFKMIAVEGGTFTMGATSEQGVDADGNEKPSHQVTLSNYYLGETEVTQELWQAVMGSNPSCFIGGLRPVEQVSWDDCQEFITKLNILTGRSFRLPTEAEWEFAARGGIMNRGYKYAGSNFISDVGWYKDNSGEATHEVATKTANAIGLYDMSGNVWEWCQDWYGSYSSSNQSDPKGIEGGVGRVNRGGCWNNSSKSCRVSCRDDDMPSRRYSGIGMRLAL